MYPGYWEQHLEGFGISQETFDERRNELERKYGFPPKHKDIVWGFLNELLRQNPDPRQLSLIYYSMAIFLSEEGRPFRSALEDARKWELYEFKNLDLHKEPKVKILTCTGTACEACEQLEGKILTIEEASEQSILPHKDCTWEMHDGHPGFCRCIYRAHIKFED